VNKGYSNIDVIVSMQLVLINISDHHTRTKVNAPADQQSTPARVVGCLLGQQSGRSVSIRNSFEVGNSFPEDANQLDFGFLHKKLEQCELERREKRSRTVFGLPPSLQLFLTILNSSLQISKRSLS
jgi:hypothetical protein